MVCGPLIFPLLGTQVRKPEVGLIPFHSLQSARHSLETPVRLLQSFPTAPCKGGIQIAAVDLHIKSFCERMPGDRGFVPRCLEQQVNLQTFAVRRRPSFASLEKIVDLVGLSALSTLVAKHSQSN